MLFLLVFKTHGVSGNAHKDIEILTRELFTALDSLTHFRKPLPHDLPHIPLSLGNILQLELIENASINGNEHGNLFRNC